MKNSLLSLLTVLTLFACKNESRENKDPNETLPPISDVFEAYYQDGLKLNPLNATAAGDNRYNDTLTNNLSEQYAKQAKQLFTNYKQKLTHYNDADLSGSDKLSKAILNWDCDINLEQLSFNNLRPIDQMWSLNLTIGQLAGGTSSQPFNTVEDYENWLSRVDDYLEWLSSAENKMKEGMASGDVLPKSLTKKVVPQLIALTGEDMENNLFYSPVKNFPDSFSENEKKTLTEAYANMVKNKVMPAYKKLADFMGSTYMDAGRESSGIEGVPNGKLYYEHQIKKYTTTNMTANEIHELGLSEVARILSEMEKIKDQVNFKGTIKQFFTHVRENKNLMPFTEPQQVIDNFNSIHERMKPQIEQLFDLKPKTAFEVRRTEAFREASASAEYNPGSLDGTRPGIFYVPIPR